MTESAALRWVEGLSLDMQSVALTRVVGRWFARLESNDATILESFDAVRLVDAIYQLRTKLEPGWTKA